MRPALTITSSSRCVSGELLARIEQFCDEYNLITLLNPLFFESANGTGYETLPTPPNGEPIHLTFGSSSNLLALLMQIEASRNSR